MEGETMGYQTIEWYMVNLMASRYLLDILTKPSQVAYDCIVPNRSGANKLVEYGMTTFQEEY